MSDAARIAELEEAGRNLVERLDNALAALDQQESLALDRHGKWRKAEAEVEALKSKLAAAESACREGLKLFALGKHAQREHSIGYAQTAGHTKSLALAIEEKLRAVLAGEGET